MATFLQGTEAGALERAAVWNDINVNKIYFTTLVRRMKLSHEERRARAACRYKADRRMRRRSAGLRALIVPITAETMAEKKADGCMRWKVKQTMK